MENDDLQLTFHGQDMVVFLPLLMMQPTETMHHSRYEYTNVRKTRAPDS